METYSLVIASTFVADPIESVLRYWGQRLGTHLSVSFAPYGQVVQQLLDERSLSSGNRDGVNVLLVRIEDWLRNLSERDDVQVEDIVRRASTDLVEAVRSAAARGPGTTIVALCPSNSPSNSPHTGRLLERAEETLGANLALSGATMVRHRDVGSLYPVAITYDPIADAAGHIPYTPDYFTALGTYLARIVVGLRRPPVKALVVDCDDTLWTGVCGEVGARGVHVDAGGADLQRFLLEQTRRGVVVCLCSKNSESDVWDVFQNNAGMLLKRCDIVASRINWNRKSENLAELAKQLNVGVDSLALLDDSAIECAEVRAVHPSVLVLQLPADRSQIGEFSRHIWELDRVAGTKEDHERTRMYQQEAQRAHLRQSSLTFEEFLESMAVEVDVAVADRAELPRIAQLTSRTNQFNTTTRRESPAELARLLSDEAHSCFVVRVRDRFGDYGLVGFFSVGWGTDVGVIDRFLLSCRSLGRGVEHRALSSAGKAAAERGVVNLVLRFVPTAKNEPARTFLDSLGAEVTCDRDGRRSYLLSSSDAAQMRISQALAANTPVRAATEDIATAVDPAAPASPGRVASWEIAMALRTVEQIRASMQAHLARPLGTPYVAPTNELERALANIWMRVLHLNAVGLEDDVLTLGANSIDFVLVSSALYQSLKVEVPVTALFDAPTVAQQALAVRGLM